VAEQIAFGQTSVKKVSSRPDVPEHLVLPGLIETPRKQKVTVSATLWPGRQRTGIFRRSEHARPTTAKWIYTIQVLKERFGIT
jgi:hypothetical protein